MKNNDREKYSKMIEGERKRPENNNNKKEIKKTKR